MSGKEIERVDTGDCHIANPWLEYECKKRELQNLNLPHDEYYRRIKQIEAELITRGSENE